MTQTPSSTPTASPISERSSFQTLKGLLPFLSPYKRQFVLAGIALLVAAGATLAIPYAFRQMIDLGFGGGDHNIKHVDLTFIARFGVACAPLRPSCL